MKTGAIQIKNLGQGKRQSIPLCLFLRSLPQFTPTCPHLTGGGNMEQVFKVDWHEGQVWTYTLDNGRKNWIRPFGQDYLEARLRAYMGNVEIHNAEIKFCAGVR